MTAATSDHARRATPLRVIGTLLAMCSIAVVAALSVLVVQSQNRARADAVQRFGDRGDVVANVLSGSVAQSIAGVVRDAPRVLSGPVSVEALQELEGLADASIPYSAVLRPDGSVIAAYPPTATIGATDESRAAIEAAANGTATMTGVQQNESGDVIEYVIPFEARDGEQRVYFIGYDASILGATVTSAVAQAIDTDTGSAFVLDDDGDIVLSVGDDALVEKLEPHVAAAARAGEEVGEFDRTRFELSSIEGTPLHFAHALPEREVIAGLPDPLWARLALVALALALLAVVTLAARAIRDAKRLEIARQEADDANAAKSQFLTHVTHELKTPIAVIRGFADLLQREPLGERPSEYVDHIDDSGRHLARLADDLLEVARVEAGCVTLAVERLDVRSVVEEVLVLAAPLAVDRRIQLEPPMIRETLPLVYADQMRLRQVLLNLLSNAIKYNHEDGVVHVEVEHRRDVVRVSVRDSGPGIAPEDLKRLFHPFERLGAEAGPVHGSGLGLCVSKGLVEAMNGTMDVSSEPGLGSTFSFELPAATEGAEGVPIIDVPVAPATAGSLVYIDDTRTSVELVRSLVAASRPGLELRTARDGSSGLELVLADPPDLLLLDLNLPDMHGEDVMRRLRADAKTADVPVLVVSADSTSRDVTRLLRTGADAYLTKPLDADQFLRVIDRLLASRPGELQPT